MTEVHDHPEPDAGSGAPALLAEPATTDLTDTSDASDAPATTDASAEDAPATTDAADTPAAEAPAADSLLDSLIDAPEADLSDDDAYITTAEDQVVVLDLGSHTDAAPQTDESGQTPPADERPAAETPPADITPAADTSPTVATSGTGDEPVANDAAPDTEPAPFGFADLGLRPELLNALGRLGYEEPTPIQRETIPLLLDGKDLLGQAATGTGKTAAFALPILERIPTSAGRAETIALILVPTRELAVQVSEAIYKYGRDLGAAVLPIYGGTPIGRQLDTLKRGVHIVVATPGRAIDHIKRGSLSLRTIQVVVLDEADEMLDMGFAEDIEAILEATPDDRQTVLFSATMPGRINSIAKRHQKDPVRIQIKAQAADAGAAPLVRQSAYIVARAHKPAALARVLDIESPVSTIVFCRTRIEVDSVSETLNGRGYRAEALHGGMSQEQRDRAMGRLKNGTADLLIATDVAARGLDIDQLTHVVNYDVPSAPEAYVHRIGRVGRAGREGVAITLAEPREQRLLGNIERLTKQKISIEKVPSVADLRARQLEQTITTLRDELQSNDLEQFAHVVDALAEDSGLRSVALAAVKLAHESTVGVIDDKEIPEVAPKKEFKKNKDFKKGDKKGEYAGKKFGGAEGSKGGYKGKTSEGDGSTAKIWIGVGRDGGVRPKDLVGAIANETSLSGRDIGAISIQAGFSLVEVPESSVDEVTWALKRTHIKGNKAKVRRDLDS